MFCCRVVDGLFRCVGFGFASSLAASFSSSVKSLFASIASFLAFNASSIACFAAGLAVGVGVTEDTLVAPSFLACSTAAFVVALSIAVFAASALAFASSLALAFSSSSQVVVCVNRIILSFQMRHRWLVLQPVLAVGVGVTLFTSVVPSAFSLFYRRICCCVVDCLFLLRLLWLALLA